MKQKKNDTWMFIIGIIASIVVVLIIYGIYEGIDYYEHAKSERERIDKVYKEVLKPLIDNMVECPSGKFIMGCPDDEFGVIVPNKSIQHEVTISEPFKIGKYEITQLEYKAVMGTNPSKFRGDLKPVECINWDDANEFCKKVNAQFADYLPKGFKFDLPTEEQWEYACRAGTTTALNNGKNITIYNKKYEELTIGELLDYWCVNLGEVAWYRRNSSDETHPVGGKKPNAWGIYDMHGNVCEWTKDFCGKVNGFSDSFYYIRGGSWNSPPMVCRSANRGNDFKSKKKPENGFRIVLIKKE